MEFIGKFVMLKFDYSHWDSPEQLLCDVQIFVGIISFELCQSKTNYPSILNSEFWKSSV